MCGITLIYSRKKAQAVVPLLEEIGDELIAVVEQTWPILRGKEDTDFTAIQAQCNRKSPNIQVYADYTCGEDEYQTGTVFNPTKNERDELCCAISNYLARKLRGKIWNVSVWVRGFVGTSFSTGWIPFWD